jgi:hypothetical protein
LSCLRLPFAKARWCVVNWLGVCTFLSSEAGSWSRSVLARAEGDGASLLCHGNFGSPQWPALGSVYSKSEWSGKAPVAVTLARVGVPVPAKGPLAASRPATLGACSHCGVCS